MVTPALAELLELTTDDLWLCMENAAGAGGTIGRSVAELAVLCDALDRHPRLGVCLDSCHWWASGVDVSDRDSARRRSLGRRRAHRPRARPRAARERLPDPARVEPRPSRPRRARPDRRRPRHVSRAPSLPVPACDHGDLGGPGLGDGRPRRHAPSAAPRAPAAARHARRRHRRARSTRRSTETQTSRALRRPRFRGFRGSGSCASRFASHVERR